MLLYLQLFWEFFKVGLFAIGGGLATIPFLYDMIDKFHWFDHKMLMDMIAVSESTPGPVGVNMATYVGYITTGSIWGGITTTFGLVLPSIIIICIVAQFLKKFKESHYVQDVFYGLRPAVTALIASAGLGILITTIFKDGKISFQSFQFIHLVLFIVLFLFTQKYKKIHPIFLICGCALLGILFQL